MKKLFLSLLAVSMTFGILKAQNETTGKLSSGSTVTDADGNIYNTVTVYNAQTWLLENLKTTKYNDGTSIPLITDVNTFVEQTTPAYCWYNNDEATYKTPYGAIYNWYAVNTGKLCPTGWHVPTDTEWTDLVNWSGGQSSAGGKLKEKGTSHWLSPNPADNSTGFTALPGGTIKNSAFRGVGYGGNWWSSTDGSNYYSLSISLFYFDGGSGWTYWGKENGFSVRCIKGITTAIAPPEEQDKDILLYPNPVGNVLNIKVPQAGSQACIIEILSVEGKVLLNETINPTANSYHINVSALQKGIYLCRVNNGIRIATLQLIKQ